jgi:membrane fusion protein, copper/silver efflux system
MKRLTWGAFLLVIVAVSFLAGSWFTGRGVSKGEQVTSRKILYYVDPMHPAYKSDKPGIAPDCGMELVPVYEDGGMGGVGTGAAGPAGTVTIGVAKQQLIGVRTDEVRRDSSSHVLRVPGRVAVDDQRLYRIVAAADGWIVDLGQNTVGRSVKKDQLLASYYTKDLLYNERLFLLSIPANETLPTQTKDFSQASVRTAGSANPQFPIDSLRGLGMSDLQIEEIHRTRTAAPHVNIYSPVSGFVLTRNISPSQRFDKGTELYRIADISRVWVMTDIFEKDRQFLKPGAEAIILYQGRRLKARMSDALPQLDAQSRILKARFELDNPDHILQPDTFVDVEVPVTRPPAITVPADAIVDSGNKKAVYVAKEDGVFEPRRVETGWRTGDQVEIVKGLMVGEKIVVSGTFLIDSESRMKAAAAGVYGETAEDPVCGMEVDQSKSKAAGRTAAYQGQTYYFCSDECQVSFNKAPAKYVAKVRPGTMTPAGQRVREVEWEGGTAKEQESAHVGHVHPPAPSAGK